MHSKGHGVDLQFINFFRALAAFWVVCAHCMIWGGWLVLVPSAKLAVDLFMLISGFLMMQITRHQSGRRAIGKFLLRRYMRIAPAYYISLLLAFTLGPLFLQGYRELQLLNPAWWHNPTYDPRITSYDIANLFSHLTFIFGLFPKMSFSTFLPDWSLSLEMQFYLAFPILALLYRAKFAVWTLALTGLALIPLARYMTLHAGFYEPSFLPMKLHFFVVGIALHIWLRERKHAVLVIAFLIACADGVFVEPFNHEAAIVPGLLLLMAYMGAAETGNRSPSAVGRLTGSAIIRFASDTSYGVYLFHGFFISAIGLLLAGTTLPGPQRVALLMLVVLPGAYGAGYLSARFIETPCTRLAGRLTGKAKERSDKPAAAS
jgi:peptidoglycan/LPS O-acetylase OafA/YrhL